MGGVSPRWRHDELRPPLLHHPKTGGLAGFYRAASGVGDLSATFEVGAALEHRTTKVQMADGDIALGIMKEEHARQSICPGPNIAWFGKTYTLKV